MAHHHLSILYTAHLYNAAQQKQGLPGGTWSEIETDIETYINSLFFGGRPKTPEDVFKRYCVRIGLPPSQLVPGNRRNLEGKVRVEGLGGDSGTQKGLSPSCLSASKTSEIFASTLKAKRARFDRSIRHTL
jgi:hypothetical protein